MPGEKVHDLQNTMTHEFGHLIGFDHNCYDPSAGRPRANDNTGRPCPTATTPRRPCGRRRMFNSASPLDVDKRDLTPDDIQAVCEVYPKGQAPMGVRRTTTSGGRLRACVGRGGPAAERRAGPCCSPGGAGGLVIRARRRS